jgi:myo-inositol-1(or 4)-monophosphatase
MTPKQLITNITIETGKEILKSQNKNISNKIQGHETHVMPEQSITSGKTIIERLKQHCPNYNYLTQEFGLENNNSEYTFIINPLAGKNNYLDRRETYTTEISLQKNKETILAAIYLPKKDELFLAELNKGATLNGEPITISQKSDLEKAIITYSTYPGEEEKTKSLDKKILSNIPKVKHFGFEDKIDPDFGRGSMGAELCYLACGRIDGLMRFLQKSWNTSAGTLIAKEAGATFAQLPEGDYITGNKKLVNKMEKLLKKD